MKKSFSWKILWNGRITTCASVILISWFLVMTAGCIPQEEPTKYPIVLAHGWGGWSSFLGYEYFYNVEQFLEARGFVVYSTAVSPVNSISLRAEELKEAILEEFPDGKVNIIAHSMGGLDSRYMIAHLGMADRIASLTMISTPNRGASICDVAMGLLPGVTEEIIDFLLNIIGLDWDGVTELTMDYVQNEFNPATPDHPDVSYFSYGGNGLFILSPLLIISAPVILLFEGVNDGLCSVASAQWGSYLGTLNADHLDEIGQVLGISEFDYLGFYLDHAVFLRTNGF